MKKRLLMVLLVVALLVAAAVVTVQAEGEHTYLDLTTYNCPCSKCGGKPYSGTWITTWTWPMVDGGHYYYKDNSLIPSSQLNYTISGEAVLVLDNLVVNSSSTGRTLRVSAGTLHLIGNNATWQGPSSSSTTGGLVQIDGAGKLHLYGTDSGTFTMQRTAGSTTCSTNGGLFRITGTNSKLTLHSGSVLNAVPVSGNGGAVHLASETYLVLDGGTINGASTNVAQGGAVYIEGGTLELKSGTIKNGYASKGGNVYLASGNLKVSGGTIKNGDASKGGNVYLASGNLMVSGGTITGGAAADEGGNVFVEDGSFNLQGGLVTAPAASQNVYVYDGGLNMTDGTISASGSSINLYLYAGTSTMSGGTITGTNGGANVYIEKGATLQQSGGTITGSVGAPNVNVRAGATFELSGKGVVSYGTAANLGGNIQNRGIFKMTGGQVLGGKVTNATGSGGSIACVGGTINISGGVIDGTLAEGDTATRNASGGGLIHNLGVMTISGGTFQDGVASVNGGLINNTTLTSGGTTFTGTLSVTGGTFQNGTANKGGLIYSSTEASISGATLKNGTATGEAADTTGQGGLIYAAGMLTLSSTLSEGTAIRGGAVYAAGTVNMTGGTISDCSASNQGGAIFMNSGSEMNISSGTVNVKDYDADTSRGIRVQGTCTLNLSGDAVINGYGKNNRDIIDVVTTDAENPATVSLAGNATVNVADGATYSGVLFQSISSGDGKLIVKEGWSGTMLMNHAAIGNNPAGTFLDTAYAAYEPNAEVEGDGFTGTLIFAESGNPYVFAKANPDAENAVQLYVAGIQLYTAAAQTWFANTADAVAAYKELTVPGYIKLYENAEVAVTEGEVYVNINGHNVTASGEGAVYAFDSSASLTEAGAGKAIGVAAEAYVRNPVNGYRYIAVGDATEGYTYHRFTVDVTGVSVRGTSAGIYYKAVINCDDTLKGLLDTYGVAVSVDSMPDEEFAVSGSKALYTSISKDSFESGKAFTGVIIENIMKPNEAANDTRAEMPIYANAYVAFAINDDVITVMADEANGGKKTTDEGFTGIAKDLKSVTKSVDSRYPTLTDAQKASLNTMYRNFGTVMDGWDLLYIGAEEGTANRELKVLTIGNSLSVDAGRMLAYVAKQEGVAITVGTLYHSGCTQAQHVKYLNTDAYEYCYYSSHWCPDPNCEKIDLVYDYAGLKWNSHTMKMGILAEKWDIILTQQGLWSSFNSATYNADMVTLRNYVTGLMTDPTNPNANPNFAFGWNMNWVPPVNETLMATSQNDHPTTGDPKVPDYYIDYRAAADNAAELNEAAQMIVYRKVANCMEQKVIASGAYPYFIPAGTMMQYANSVVETENEDILYRDYIHASDKMRLATAYLWLYTLTGKSFDDLNMVTEVPNNLLYNAEVDAEGVTELLTADEKALFETAIKNAVKDPLGANIPNVTE